METGNVLSQQYASSEAMKQDFTLYGKRTAGGKLKDLGIYFKRLFKNNLGDGKDMDGYRLV